MPRPTPGEAANPISQFARNSRRLRQFTGQLPIDLLRMGVENVNGAASTMTKIIEDNETGLLSNLPAQLRVARRMAAG